MYNIALPYGTCTAPDKNIEIRYSQISLLYLASKVFVMTRALNTVHDICYVMRNDCTKCHAINKCE